MFACNYYPADAEFLDSVEKEVVHQVRFESHGDELGTKGNLWVTLPFFCTQIMSSLSKLYLLFIKFSNVRCYFSFNFNLI